MSCEREREKEREKRWLFARGVFPRLSYGDEE
jgi:hypothetical protein